MYVLEVGDSVVQLRFLPDGRRLLVGTVSSERVMSYDVWTLSGGGRVRLQLPEVPAESWDYWEHGPTVAFHPTGERCYVAWNGHLLASRTADGALLPGTEGVKAHQVVLSPGGDRVVTVRGLSGAEKHLTALTADESGVKVVWEKTMPREFRLAAGFLPDGERFVTVADAVRVCAFGSGEEQSAARYPSHHASQPRLSADGRHLGVIGYGSMYLYETAALGKPRRIGGKQTFGNFRSFAFHPNGRTLAVIHGGPTLVKVYDLQTLRLTRKYLWKLGPLGAMAFSPDGMLGAAGSLHGQVVVWDVDA